MSFFLLAGVGWKHSAGDRTAQRPVAGVPSVGGSGRGAGGACKWRGSREQDKRLGANVSMMQRLLLAISTDKRDEVVLLVKAGVSLDITVRHGGKVLYPSMQVAYSFCHCCIEQKMAGAKNETR